MDQQCVIFKLQNESYGVDIASVEGIIKMQEITVMPHAPSFVDGITNLRGSVVPVIDLRRRFGMPSAEHTRDTRIVIVNLEGKKVGMTVDEVSEVIHIHDSQIEPAPSIVTTIDSGFIKGIAKDTGRLVILINLQQVLTSGERVELAAAF